MSATPVRRRRARKACIPCHQRKRKCDGQYPCRMCTTYDYPCRYTPATPHLRDPEQNNGSGIHGLAGTQPSNQSQTSRAPQTVNTPTVADTASATINGTSDEPTDAGESAAMTFPHYLSRELDSSKLPNIHDSPYNFGTRPEDALLDHVQLSSIISEHDLNSYSRVYFSKLGLISDYMDSRIYNLRCQDFYTGSDTPTVIFGAVAAGIAAVGSLLSPLSYAREKDLLRYAKTILDDPAIMRNIGTDHIIAWAVRVFYLRATSRPLNAWIASCTLMHLCEAIGLHDDQKIKKMAATSGAAGLGNDADRLRRIFWISWAANNLLSYEYDRSPVYIRNITTQSILPMPGSIAHQFVGLAQIIPGPNSSHRLENKLELEQLLERLEALYKYDCSDPFLLVTKADIAFSLYRRIHQMQKIISDDGIKIITDIGQDAVRAAEQLAKHGRLFWNVIGSVFQFSCVLLAIDTPASHAHIPTAFTGLRTLVEVVGTKATRDALAVAQHLLNLSVAKKKSVLTHLESMESNYGSRPQANTEVNFLGTDFDQDLDWSQFGLEPWVSSFDFDFMP